MPTSTAQKALVRVPFRMHPRVFSALGSDLVTNDVVAIIELVKNSYDAFATRVDVRFGEDGEGPFIEIQDDGVGMTSTVIDDVWCVVATPYRHEKPLQARNGKTRRASGEKGLGRLAAARLGRQLQLITKATGQSAWQVEVDWADIAKSKKLDSCYATRVAIAKNPFEETGTRIRISKLRSQWTAEKVADLKDNLSRLASPFENVRDFSIWFTPPGFEASAVEIESPEFLSKPPYEISGTFSKTGTLSYKYSHSPLSGKKRQDGSRVHWDVIREAIRVPASQGADHPICGPFTFEIRAWDIGAEDVEEVAGRFRLQKNSVRKAIRAFKGISLYRDSILVLPKSDTARDWLGLDLRRVSKVGTRLSTSQIIGFVAISAAENAGIEDTSDRERLVQSDAVREFQAVLRYIISVFETQRDQDRQEAKREEPPLKEILEKLSVRPLLASLDQLAKSGVDTSETVPVVTAFSRDLESAKEQIEKRLVFYSRLATIGTLAEMLIHEVGNKTLVIGRLISSVQELSKRLEPADKGLEREVELAEIALVALGQLAERFSPLASRSYSSRKRDCILEDTISDCLAARADVIARLKASINWQPKTKTRVGIDPGELFAVVVNLLDNALYWMSRHDVGRRRLAVTLKTTSAGKRIEVGVHDSGPGVKEEDAERIFWPGVTRRPGGIGMGLTVASELVAEHGGQMKLETPGELGGASFVFDLPAISGAR